MTLSVGMATIDCENPQRLAEFYSQALDMNVLGDYGEFVFLGGWCESSVVWGGGRGR